MKESCLSALVCCFSVFVFAFATRPKSTKCALWLPLPVAVAVVVRVAVVVVPLIVVSVSILPLFLFSLCLCVCVFRFVLKAFRVFRSWFRSLPHFEFILIKHMNFSSVGFCGLLPPPPHPTQPTTRTLCLSATPPPHALRSTAQEIFVLHANVEGAATSFAAAKISS